MKLTDHDELKSRLLLGTCDPRGKRWWRGQVILMNDAHARVERIESRGALLNPDLRCLASRHSRLQTDQLSRHTKQTTR